MTAPFTVPTRPRPASPSPAGVPDRGGGTPRLVPATREGLRRNNFNTLRLLMAGLVVWSHCFAVAFGTEEGEPLSMLTAGTYNAGNVGVLAFFAISGFLITNSWLQSSSWQSYLAKRIARIYPGYLVTVLVCSFVVVPAFSSRGFGLIDAHELASIAGNLLLTNYILPSDAFGDGVVNGSLWSIGYEFRCYLGVLALGLVGLARRGAAFLVIALGCMTVRAYLDLSGLRPAGGELEWIVGYPYFWVTVMPPFALGASVLLFRDRLPRSGVLLLLLGAATLGCAHLPVADPWRLAVTHAVFPLFLTYAVFYVAFHPRIRLGDAARHGDFSYGTYLYAFPVQRMIWVAFGASLSFAGYVASALALSLACGVASWFVVERWFEVRRLRRSGPPLAAEATLAAP